MVSKHLYLSVSHAHSLFLANGDRRFIMQFPDVKGDWSTYSWGYHCSSGRRRGRAIVLLVLVCASRVPIIIPPSWQQGTHHPTTTIMTLGYPSSHNIVCYVSSHNHNDSRVPIIRPPSWQYGMHHQTTIETEGYPSSHHHHANRVPTITPPLCQ